MALAPSLALLNDELESLIRERQSLREEHKGDVMPDDAKTRDAQIVERVQRVRVLIDQEQQRKRDALMDDTQRYLEDPNYRIPKAVNADDESKRMLRDAGWGIKGGMVTRHTLTRGEMAYVPEAVLFGPIPTDDPVAAQHYKEVRASFQPEYRAAYMKWLRMRGAIGRLTGPEQAALSEGTAIDGGVTVPADVAAEMQARRADASVIRGMATIRQTNSDRIQFPAVKPNSTSGSIYSSGFVGGMVGEVVVGTDQSPQFEQFEIGIKDFQAWSRLSNNLINDSSQDMLGFLATDGGRNLGLVEDDKFLNGIGTGLEPMGLLSVSGITSTTSVEGTTTDHISSTAADAGSIPKIITFAYTLPAQYAQNASWLMSRDTQGRIHGLVDGENRPWWQPAAGAGGAPGAPAMLLNSPVKVHAFMPSGGTNGNKVLVYGDFSALIIAERQSLVTIIDTVNQVGSNQTDIYLRSRAGSGVWNTDAFRIAIV